MDVITVLVAVLIVSLGFVAITVLCAMITGLEIETITIGSLIQLGEPWRVNGINVAIGVIPISSSVKFRDIISEDEAEPFSPLYSLPLAQSLLVALAPLFMVLLTGAVIYYVNPGRSFQLGSLYLIWTGITGLLPIPGMGAYAAILRIVTPRGRSPSIETPIWLAVTIIVVMFGLTMLVLWLLAFRGDNTLAAVARFLPSLTN